MCEEFKCNDKVFNEKTQAFLVGKYYEHLVNIFGERGEKAFTNATIYYATQRGRRMAQRAIRDGKDLTFQTYMEYGEWASTDYTKSMNQSNDNHVIENNKDYVIEINTCPWHIQFNEMGNKKAGIEYCKYLDTSICRGFNPDIVYEVEEYLHTSKSCIHRIKNANMENVNSVNKDPNNMKPFSYHCAHLFWSFNEVITSVFECEGKRVTNKVLNDFVDKFGLAAGNVLLSYRNENFNIIF